MEEWLDVVDDTDRVIGQALRTDIHRRQLRHRASHVVLFDTAGRVFIQRRSEQKAENPGLWDSSAAGHVNSGESYIACAVREVYEELGLLIAVEQLEHRLQLAPSASNGFEFAAVFTLVSDHPLSLQTTEIAEGRWLAVPELNTRMRREPTAFTGVFRDIWRDFSTDRAKPAGTARS